MKAAVISLGSTSSKWIHKELKNYFKEVDHLNLKSIEISLQGKKGEQILYKGEPIGNYDCIYAKGSFKYTALLRAITTILTKRGTYMPLRASTFTVGNDKFLTQLKLQQFNIPMPGTYLSPTVEAAKSVIKRLNYPIIMKFPQGTHGKGVMLADSYPSASSMLDALVALNQPFIIQDFVETGGVDTRAIVIGDKVVASMKRIAKQGESRANIHAGGTGEGCVLDRNAKKIAIDAARAVGAEICAVDLLEGPMGPVVIEINTSPGLQGITGATKINVADKIAKHLYDRAQEVKGWVKEETASEILKQLDKEADEKQGKLLFNIELRGKRILLPEIVTKLTKFKEDDELELTAKPKYLEVKEFDINKQ